MRKILVLLIVYVLISCHNNPQHEREVIIKSISNKSTGDNKLDSILSLVSLKIALHNKMDSVMGIMYDALRDGDIQAHDRQVDVYNKLVHDLDSINEKVSKIKK